jgi:hypothetical protein
VPARIREVDDQPDDQPDQETQPSHSGQLCHQIKAEGDADDREDRRERHPEGSFHVRPRTAQHNDTDVDQDEREERSDIDQLDDGSEWYERGKEGNQDAEADSQPGRCAESRVCMRQPPRESPSRHMAKKIRVWPRC